MQGSQEQVLYVCVEAVKHIVASGNCQESEMRSLKTVLGHLDDCTMGSMSGLPPSVVGQVLLSMCKVRGVHLTSVAVVHALPTAAGDRPDPGPA